MTTFRLLTLEFGTGGDPTGLHHVVRRCAGLLGFADMDATRAATAVSELGRYARARRSRSVTLDVHAGSTASTVLTVTVTFDDDGPEPAASTRQAVARLTDEFLVEPRVVRISKQGGRMPDRARLESIRDELLQHTAADDRAMLQSLNDDLLATLLTLREREAELVTLNEELSSTNRGVVALYAELEQRSTEVRNAQRRVFEQLEDALRPPPPEVAGAEIGVRYLPADANSPTGGDLYDWFVRPDGHLHVTVVDVQGHGVASTRDALHVTHAVRTLALDDGRFGDILARADTILQVGPSAVVATAIMARLDPATGLLNLAGAGHPPALHVPAVGEPRYVEAGGRPIGYEGGGSRAVTTIQLEPHDTVLLYTDGLVELNRDIIAGLDDLRAAAGSGRRDGLEQLLDATLFSCIGGDALTDDTLLLAIRWTPSTVSGA